MNRSSIAKRMRAGEKGISLSPQTRFRKGHTPHNKLPVGSETIRVDKNGALRQWIKIEEPKVWILYAVHVWTVHGGKIPDGFILHHLDHDALNDSINNLSLVTRSTHIKLHTSELQESKPKLTHIKKKTCPDCDITYQGRGKSIARCQNCARLARRKSNREYKRRKKANKSK